MTVNRGRSLLDARAETSVAELVRSGQHKALRHVTGPTGPVVRVEGVGELLLLCSNDYLGLAAHPEVVAAAADALRRYGVGTASVRFICGTLDIHRELEADIAALVGTPTALTYGSCWNANEALLPTVTAPGDVVLSDALNHASIIDAARLVAKGVDREVFAHRDLAALDRALAKSRRDGILWVVTDGVFSMEGDVVDLAAMAALCRAHDAVLVVDDSHGVGVLGATGRGTPEHYGMIGAVDILTGTLGKALGGASGGYVAASQPVTELLVQRSRPSLFSNALPATTAAAARAAIAVLRRESERVARLHTNTARLRAGLGGLGFDCLDSPSAIIPIMVGDADQASSMSRRLLELGVWVVGFAFPVVPTGEARLRIQVSAALTEDDIDRALDAFRRL